MKNKIERSNKQAEKANIDHDATFLVYKTAQYEFKVSEHMVWKEKEVVEEKGTLELPDPKKGKGLSEEVVRAEKNFYCDNKERKTNEDKDKKDEKKDKEQ